MRALVPEGGVILVLGGGFDQAELISFLKEKGFYVVVIDYNEAPVSACLADEHLPVNALDADSVLAVARDRDAVLVLTSGTDQPLYVAALVSEELNLPFPFPAQKAQDLTNKKFMKSVLLDHGIPTPDALVCTQDDLVAARRLKCPLVCKPLDANSSKGISKVTRFQGLADAVGHALAFSRVSEVIIEEFVDGLEISIDAWIDKDGDVHLLAISKLFKLDNGRGDFPIICSEFDTEFYLEWQEEVTRILRRIGDAFNIRHSPLLVQAIVDDSGVHVIELSSRIGGGGKHKLIERLRGFNLNRHLGETFIRSTDGSFSAPPLCCRKHVAMVYLYADGCDFDEIRGISGLVEQGVIDDAFITRPAGIPVPGARNSSDRIGSIVVEDDDADCMRLRIRQALSTLHVVDQRTARQNLLGIDLAWMPGGVEPS